MDGDGTGGPTSGAAGVDASWTTVCGDEVSVPTGLTIYYDVGCALCRRCRAWLETQRTWVPLRFVAADAEQAEHLLPQLPWLGTELVVVGDDGSAWVGPAAFLTCLWATRRYRGWSRRLSGPAFAPMAEQFFHLVSDNRRWLARAGGLERCDDGTCRHRGHVVVTSPPPSRF